MRKLIRSLTSILVWDVAKKKIFSFWVAPKFNGNILKRVYSVFDINFLACHRSLTFETESDFSYLIIIPYYIDDEVKVKVAVLSDSLWPHELYNPQNSPGQNTGVGNLSLLQGIFPTQGSNPDLPQCRWLLYQLSHQGSPVWMRKVRLKNI